MMPHPPTPWIGLAAIVAMFVLPFLPARLFDGPRTIKRYARRVVCGDCGERWTDDHECAVVLSEAPPPRRRLRADLRRTSRPRALPRTTARTLERRRF
jgi:hypothetical protein